MWSIALKTLVSDRGKLLTALVGVIFSVVLVNIQGGLFLGLIRKASLLIDNGQADIWVGHRSMHNADFARDIPRRWVHRIRSIPGVKRAEPCLVGGSEMTLPSGGFEGVLVVGSDADSPMARPWNIVEGTPEAIRQTDGIIVDAGEDDKLESPQIGELREINGHRARIVAKTEGVMGFLITPYVFTTYDRAAAYLRMPATRASYFLVQLEPGVDAAEVCSLIRQRLPEADAYPRDEYAAISVNFWMTRTGLGISFGAATLLGLLVGLVMVAQTLYALVLDRISEFGALEAMGAGERHIHSLLLTQAITMAIVGSGIGLVMVFAIQRLFDTPKAPIAVPWWLALGSGGLVSVICLVSTLLPYLRVRKVDPVMVLQS